MKLLLSVFLLTLSTVALAQTGFGIKGGLNLSGVRTDNELIIENEPKLGWQAGGFVKSLGTGWGFWAETYLNVEGSKQQFGDESQKNTIGYLSLPIGLHYSTESKFSFYLGGYVSFRLWANRKSSKPGVGDFETNISENIAFIDYGPWAGVSYTYQRFIFDLRYLYGIPNANTNPQLNVRAFTYSGQLSIGYYLGRRNQRY
jgi:hypothetical protein